MKKILEKSEIKIDHNLLLNKDVLLSDNVETFLKNIFIQIVYDNKPGIIKVADLKNKYIDELKLVKNIDINEVGISNKNLKQIFKNSIGSNINNTTHLLRDIRINFYYGKIVDDCLKPITKKINKTELPNDFSKLRTHGNFYFVTYNNVVHQNQDEVKDNYAQESTKKKITTVKENPFKSYSVNDDFKDILNKIDYDKRNKEASEIGFRGEEYVINYEKERLISENQKELSDKVKWISKISDSFGYDILSFEKIDKEYKPIFIEVKTTTSKYPSHFFLTKNEYKFSIDYEGYYRLYFLYDINNKPTLYIYKGKIEEEFKLDALTFKVSKK